MIQLNSVVFANYMIEVLDIITIIVSTFWLIKNIKRLGEGSRFLILFLVYVFYILPIGLDWFYKMADYSVYYGRVGFILSRKDFLTVFIYDIGMISVQYLLIKGKTRRKRRNGVYAIEQDRNHSLCRITMIIGMVLPAIATVLLIHEYGMLFIPQWREMKLFPDDG